MRHPSLKEIKEIFPSATGVGLILPYGEEGYKGLKIRFNRCVSLFDELQIEKPSVKIFHSGLFELNLAYGFVALENCKGCGAREDASQLSSGKDVDQRFIQDPPHYDVPPPHNQLGLPQEQYMSGICNELETGREEDTLIALEEDFRSAIIQLNKDNLHDDVCDALAEMSKPDYHFRLYHPLETEARDIVRRQYPEFTADVFALIPEGRKYRQSWLSGQWNTLFFSNVYGKALHGRATGRQLLSHETAKNPLSGLYLFKG